MRPPGFARTWLPPGPNGRCDPIRSRPAALTLSSGVRSSAVMGQRRRNPRPPRTRLRRWRSTRPHSRRPCPACPRTPRSGKCLPLSAAGAGLPQGRSRAAKRIELRHYLLHLASPRLGDWPEIVASIRLVCDEPGLTIERFFLAAAPDGAAVFIRAEVGLTVRLRPQAVSRAGAYGPRRRHTSGPLHSATTRLSRSC